MFKLTPGPLFSIIGIVIISGLLLTSCKTGKSASGYFTTLKKDTSISRFVSPQMESKIQPGDILGIVFKSLNAEENLRYNAGVLSTGAGVFNNIPSYQVETDGTIKVNRLGQIQAGGLTRRDLAKKLETEMSPYLKDPIVEVSYLNHKVTLIGNITRPQVLNITTEQISLLDAIVMGGDLTENAVRNDIMIIRDTNDQKIIKHINLTDHSIFNSPWYYLKPNDIVYVSADMIKADKEEKRRQFQTNFSLAASGITLLIVIIDRLTR